MSTTNVPNLFANAQQEGELSAQTMNVINKIPNMGAKIKANLGINMQDVPASDVVLVSLLIDDSGSIQSANNEQLVRDGYNLVLESLLAAKQKNNILITVQYLNGTVLFPYVLLQDAVRMDATNYRANGGTPLYDKTVEMLTTVLAKTRESYEDGTPARSITLIITDGEDVHSRHNTAADVAVLTKEMLSKEDHIIATMGVDNGSTDFRKIFADMGIQDKWVLTPGNNPKEIRQAFQMFSQSAVRASQTAANIAGLGGFGA